MRSIVLYAIFIYALSLVIASPVTFLVAIDMLNPHYNQPRTGLLMIAINIGSLTLLGSAIGLYFKKRISYYLAIISFTIIGLSGIINNIVIEGLTKEPAGPYGIIPDIFWFLIVPIGMIAYLVYDLEKSRKEVIK